MAICSDENLRARDCSRRRERRNIRGMSQGAHKKRIAILGGGVSAMTTAYYLTSYPGWKDDWEIDVYQMGWRLGGKGASGRNAAHNQRIEEHGLHIFLGFYDNAFKTMQSLYSELARSPGEPLATWDEAWKPADYVAL